MSSRAWLSLLSFGLLGGCALFLGLDDKTFDGTGGGGAGGAASSSSATVSASATTTANTTSSVSATSSSSGTGGAGGGVTRGSTLWAIRAASDQAIVGQTLPSGVCVDPTGAIWWTGYFGGTLTFPNNHTFTAPGESKSTYLVKLDPSGGWLWGVQLDAGMTATDALESQAIACDGSGAIIAGTLNGSFDGVSSPGATTAFMLRVAPSGLLGWHAVITSSLGDVKILAIARNAAGAIALGGEGSGDLTSGALVLNGSATPHGFAGAINEGAIEAMFLSSADTPAGSSINDVDISSTWVTVTGQVNGKTNLGGCDITPVANDAFVALFDMTGACKSSAVNDAPHQPTSTQAGLAVRLLAKSVVAAGTFGEALRLPPQAAIASSTADDMDAYAASLALPSLVATAPLAQLGQTGVSNSRAYLNSIAVDPLGGIALAASATDSPWFFGQHLVTAGMTDIVIAHAAGDLKSVDWIRTIGGAAGDYGHRVAAAPNGDVVATGMFGGMVDFGIGSLTAKGAWDLYLIKLAR